MKKSMKYINKISPIIKKSSSLNFTRLFVNATNIIIQYSCK